MDTQEPTQDLVTKAQKGDSEAFGKLAERYRVRLERQIDARMGAKVRGQLDPADVVQETLTRAYQSIGLFRWQGEESFYTWLAGIAEHLLWNVSKKKVWQPLRIDRPASSSHSPSKEARREERFDRLEKALQGLAPDQKKVIRLSRIEGLSLKEIAAVMGRSPGAVQKLLSRAILRLKESFGETESIRLPDRAVRLDDGSGDAAGRKSRGQEHPGEDGRAEDTRRGKRSGHA
jgi:RNA polymerase sigma-70 factor (ECF subfamily)